MKLLLDRRREATIASITEETITAAATCGQTPILDLLSQQNGLISVQDEWRCIAKFYNVAKAGDIRRVEQLIHQGTKSDMKNIRGETPLWIAAKNEHHAVVKVLAQRTDVNVNSTSITGRSPLFWPSENGNERIAAILMEAGADSDLVDENGDTAVTVARKNGRRSIVKVLERSGRTS
ncbi:ankyrin repeat-containing protein [Dactylonectria macrodidyma]|uniref:Ankyrin repeat-containing protein n=1 Tax=Dactylonectria macrodidyma TaxID=307937 RepID=A0A9P9DPR2_9HYPO|nr:ankyrin repeat-containing protein [Dactylonectria macrodidyma]